MLSRADDPRPVAVDHQHGRTRAQPRVEDARRSARRPRRAAAGPPPGARRPAPPSPPASAHPGRARAPCATARCPAPPRPRPRSRSSRRSRPTRRPGTPPRPARAPARRSRRRTSPRRAGAAMSASPGRVGTGSAAGSPLHGGHPLAQLLDHRATRIERGEAGGRHGSSIEHMFEHVKSKWLAGIDAPLHRGGRQSRRRHQRSKA